MIKLTENLKLKLLSLAMAIFLWVFVMGTVNPTITKDYYNIPITYKNLDTIQNQNKTMVGATDKTVNITFEGDTDSFVGVKASDIKAEIDLKEYNPNNAEMKIQYIYPQGLRIKSASMTSVPLRVEAILSKEIEVELAKKGEPKDGLYVTTGAVAPQTVVAKGPKSVVESIAKALAEVDMASIGSTITRNIPIEFVDSKGALVDGVEFSQSFVNATFKVMKVVNYPIKFVTTGKLPQDFVELSKELNHTEVNMLLDGEPEKEIKEIETNPLDLSKVIKTGTYDLTLKIPKGLKLRDSDFKLEVKYKVDFPDKKIFKIASSTVEIKKDPNSKVELAKRNDFIEVEARGMKSVLDKVTSSQIKILVDATGLNTGSHNLEPKAEAIPNITTKILGPSELGVSVTK